MGTCFTGVAVAILWRAWLRCHLSDVRSLAATLQDDSFYYLLPAFRWHETGTWTFDGEHLTYGFQWLFAAALTALAGGCEDRESFLRAAVFLSHVLFVLTGVILVWLVRRMAALLPDGFAALVGWVGGALWLVDTPLLLAHTTLKENGAYVLLLALALLTTVAARERPTPLRLSLASFLSMCAVLLRITTATVAVELAVSCWLLAGERRRRCIPVAIGACLAFAPWAALTWHMFGHLMPTPGSIKTEWLGAAVRDGTLAGHLANSAGWIPGYVADVVLYCLGHHHGLHVPQWWVCERVGGGVLAWGKTALLVIALLRTCCVNGLAWPTTARGWVWVVALASLVATATNPLTLNAGGDPTLLTYAQWYVAAEPLLLTLLMTFAFVPPVIQGTERTDGLARPLSIALAGLLLVLGTQAALAIPILPSFAPIPAHHVHQSIVAAELANQTLPPGSRIGSWNAGALAWFSRGDVVNLDGLANDDVVASRRAG